MDRHTDRHWTTWTDNDDASGWPTQPYVTRSWQVSSSAAVVVVVVMKVLMLMSTRAAKTTAQMTNAERMLRWSTKTRIDLPRTDGIFD